MKSRWPKTREYTFFLSSFLALFIPYYPHSHSSSNPATQAYLWMCLTYILLFVSSFKMYIWSVCACICNFCGVFCYMAYSFLLSAKCWRSSLLLCVHLTHLNAERLTGVHSLFPCVLSQWRALKTPPTPHYCKPHHSKHSSTWPFLDLCENFFRGLMGILNLTIHCHIHLWDGCQSPHYH